MNTDLTMDVGERDGLVLLRFSQPVTEVPLTPELAQKIGETIARASYGATYGTNAPKNKSAIAEALRAKLLTRVTHVIRNLSEKNKPPLFIANQVVDTILSEAL